MTKSWDSYYQKHKSHFDEDHRLIIYLIDGDDNPDVLDELEEKDYTESEADTHDDVVIGEYSLGECATVDEIGEEFLVDATLIFHKVPQGWMDATWFNGGVEAQKEFVLKWFHIAPEFVLELGVEVAPDQSGQPN